MTLLTVWNLFLLIATLLGHFALAVWLFNRLHAVAWPRWSIDLLEKVLVLGAAALLVGFVWRWYTGGPLGDSWLPIPLDRAWAAYGLVCLVSALAAIPLWLVPKLREKPVGALVSNHTACHDLVERLGHKPVQSWKTRVAATIPGNEILKLHVQQKTLLLPQLPAGLEGLKIAHLSDLHMTGKLSPAFYREVVDLTNDEQPDLTVITGDIAERAECLEWIQPTLGRLKARLGVYFILGNHEKRLGDVGPLREVLQSAGIRDLGGRYAWIDNQGTRIFLAGTERPWFGHHPDVRTGLAESSASSSDVLKILLSHTPDQYAFARSHQFDLMLAGHNHGGQIRLPWLGALITPSRFGYRYAGGLYHEPPTLLHVTRGIAGLHSLRFNCPPELAVLVLTGETLSPRGRGG